MIERITVDDPLYAGEVALREAVLLSAVGLTFPRFQQLFPHCDPGAEHFVAVEDGRVVGCALLVVETGQLMQMAVAEVLQGRGVGRQLVRALEQRGPELGHDTIFCHARHVAADFYARCGWTIEGEPFDEVGIRHYRMRSRPLAR